MSECTQSPKEWVGKHPQFIFVLKKAEVWPTQLPHAGELACKYWGFLPVFMVGSLCEFLVCPPKWDKVGM